VQHRVIEPDPPHIHMSSPYPHFLLCRFTRRHTQYGIRAENNSTSKPKLKISNSNDDIILIVSRMHQPLASKRTTSHRFLHPKQRGCTNNSLPTRKRRLSIPQHHYM